MNNLNVKFDNVEHSQSEVNRKLNQLEAESTLVLLILEAINKKGAINQ